MGITQLIDPFYIDISGERFRNQVTPGQLCWVPSPQPDRIPQILEAQRADPAEHYLTKFKIRNVTETDFHRKSELPLYRLRLRLNEELIIQIAKRRPAIVLPSSTVILQDIAQILRSKGKKHLQQNCIIVIPIFDIERPQDPKGFPPEMVVRIKALLYNQFFYCPRTPSGMAPIEGVARLDRIQVVFQGHRASFDPLPIKLSEDARTVLTGLLRSWLCIKGASEDERYLHELKELVKETLPVQPSL
jgi:hypothetical protein